MPIKKDGTRKILSIALSTEIYEDLQREADKRSLSLSSLSRMVIKTFLDEQEKHK